jgi:hypothetical protein
MLLAVHMFMEGSSYVMRAARQARWWGAQLLKVQHTPSGVVLLHCAVSARLLNCVMQHT